MSGRYVEITACDTFDRLEGYCWRLTWIEHECFTIQNYSSFPRSVLLFLFKLKIGERYKTGSGLWILKKVQISRGQINRVKKGWRYLTPDFCNIRFNAIFFIPFFSSPLRTVNLNRREFLRCVEVTLASSPQMLYLDEGMRCKEMDRTWS